MLEEVLQMAHFLNRLVLVNLPYQDCPIRSVAGVRFSTLLYLCIVGKDLGTNI